MISAQGLEHRADQLTATDRGSVEVVLFTDCKSDPISFVGSGLDNTLITSYLDVVFTTLHNTLAPIGGATSI